MLALIRDEIVVKKKWMNDDELIEMTGLAESTPGPIAINLATYLGYKKRGYKGSIFATLGVVLPTFLVMLIISLAFKKLFEFQVVQFAFIGVKCAVIFLVLKTAINMIKSLKDSVFAVILFSLLTISIILLTVFSIDVSAIFFILGGALIGVIFYGLIFAKREVKKWYF